VRLERQVIVPHDVGRGLRRALPVYYATVRGHWWHRAAAWLGQRPHRQRVDEVLRAIAISLSVVLAYLLWRHW
jgi:hypothetical protein